MLWHRLLGRPVSKSGRLLRKSPGRLTSRSGRGFEGDAEALTFEGLEAFMTLTRRLRHFLPKDLLEFVE
jgi:hypothetical protein